MSNKLIKIILAFLIINFLGLGLLFLYIKRETQTLKSSISNVDDELQQVKESISNVDISDLESKIEDIESSVSNLESDISSLKSRVFSLELWSN